MSWVKIKTRHGLIKIKPRWQLRWAEKTRRVRVIDLGVLIISWWSDEDMNRF